MNSIASQDHLTLGHGKKCLETDSRTRWRGRLAALGLLAAFLGLPAMAQGSGAAPAVPVGLPATTTPTTPTTGTATTAAQVSTPTPRWGEGVLELEFLRKLRVFLETDPFDFKAFEAAFGVGFKADPPDGPHPGGSWGMDETRRVLPFGQTFNNRSRGGVRWSFDPRRNTSYLSMEFVKLPPAGKRVGDGLPCISPELIGQVFGDRWVGSTTYTEIRVYRATTSVPSTQNFRWLPDAPGEISLSFPLRHDCAPYFFVSTKRLPRHPATN